MFQYNTDIKASQSKANFANFSLQFQLLGFHHVSSCFFLQVLPRHLALFSWDLSASSLNSSNPKRTSRMWKDVTLRLRSVYIYDISKVQDANWKKHLIFRTHWIPGASKKYTFKLQKKHNLFNKDWWCPCYIGERVKKLWSFSALQGCFQWSAGCSPSTPLLSG